MNCDDHNERCMKCETYPCQQYSHDIIVDSEFTPHAVDELIWVKVFDIVIISHIDDVSHSV